MHAARHALRRPLDLGEGNLARGCVLRRCGRHRAEYRPPGRRPYLRTCATNERLAAVVEATISSETERQRFAAVGRALADPKRLCVLETLAAGERSVGELSRDVGCQVPNMSQHLAVLRSSGLVTARRDGTTGYYRLTDSRVLEAYRLIQTIAR